jgi:hypothetical protein
MGTTPTGILSAPKDKLRKVLAACPTIQTWFAAPPLTPLDKIRYSFVRGRDDDIATMRPFAVVDWNHFAMKQIAGGDQNFLWPDGPLLGVLIEDNDLVAPADPAIGLTDDEIMEGDIQFENLFGGVLADLGNLAAVNDYLSVTEINVTIPPSRNPIRDWGSAGAYHFAGFTVAYN